MSEIDKDLELGEEEEQNETGNEEKEEGGEESKPESKPRLTKEQKLGLLKRQVTKLEKDLGVVKEESKPEVQKKEDKKGFDYAEKAYLKASGIQSNEFELVQEIMQGTGKSLDEVLEAKYFQAELKERREEKASKDALPTGSKRSSSPTRSNVDYWVAKGELPTADQVDLRRKVVREKMKQEGTKSRFTDTPVA